MSAVLVDSSVWIEYFKNAESPITAKLDSLIDIGNVFINDLILAELLPFIKIKRQNQLVDILISIERLPLDIQWKEIIDLQTVNLKNGINKIGIPDLIILQNVIQHKASLFTLDKHFSLMKRKLKLHFNLEGHFD